MFDSYFVLTTLTYWFCALFSLISCLLLFSFPYPTLTIDRRQIVQTMDATVNRVSIEMQTFSEETAVGWFTILEAQFRLNRVTTETTKFYQVLAKLPAHIANRIPRSVIQSENYGDLKRFLLRAQDRSKTEILDKLSSEQKIIGRPSAFLQELMSAADRFTIGEDLIRHKFLRAPPPITAQIIQARQDLSLNELGRLADDMVAFNNTGSKVEETAFRVGRQIKNTTSNDSSTKIPLSLTPYKKGQRQVVCRAHLFYGDQARSCQTWCVWPKKRPGLRNLPNSQSSSPLPSGSEN